MYSRRGVISVSDKRARVCRGADSVSSVTIALLAETDGPPASAIGPTGAPLVALAGGALAARFVRWRGATGKYYICSVFSDRSSGANVLPHYTDAVVIAVSRRGGISRIDFVTESSDSPELFWSTMQNCRTIDEFHLHLLAQTPSQRRSACADLANGHSCRWLRLDRSRRSLHEQALCSTQDKWAASHARVSSTKPNSTRCSWVFRT
jgi:hypothetical protein